MYILYSQYYSSLCVLSSGYFSELVHFCVKVFNECNEGYNHIVSVKFHENSFPLKICQNHK